MDRILSFTIDSRFEGKRLLDYLRAEGFSRHILSRMKADSGAILHNGVRGYGKTILKTGDQLTIHIPEEEPSSNILPVPMDLDIIYEDEDMIVLNKPADMPVHPSMGNHENTLANGVAAYYQKKGETFVYRCINRLDRDTSGVLVLAKNPYSAAGLSDQMRARQIHRTYLAIVDGIPPEKGTIDAPIARMDDSAITREVNFERGEPAVTHFERLDVKSNSSLIELHLETGRTHQIRVHMKYAGYPLLGDFLYHPVFDRISRQALHSFQLEFTHPVTKAPLRFLAPVPCDFKKAFS